MSRSDFVALRDVHFSHESSAAPLFPGISLRLPSGWTGVVGPNGGGKTTLLRLVVGELAPQQGLVTAPVPALLCEQRTDRPPPLLASLLESRQGDAARWRERLRVPAQAIERWETLSFGERKRVQLAVALWQRPALLAVDEPTNHVDAEARAILLAALREFRGVGLLVSHDRELLDALGERCLFLDPPEATLRPGGYSAGASQAAADRERAVRERDLARRERDRTLRETIRRREEASRAHRRRSKRGLSRHDHDARARIDLARVSGKDGQAGRLLRQLDGRLDRAEQALATRRTRKQYALGVFIAGVRSQRDALLRLPAGTLALGPERRLQMPELVIRPDDRIALTGPNGAGKSTLFHALVSQASLPPEHLTLLPQEITAAASRSLAKEAQGLAPAALGRVMTAVSCLGSRPGRLLATPEPSPGELRKLLLALGLARAPHLLALDEPTNHLDLPSIECLETALSDCPCAMLLVSHDRPFLARLARTEWRLVPVEGGDTRLEIAALRAAP